MHERQNEDPPRRARPKPGTSEDYRELKDELERFKQDERRAEDEIGAELRREHFGHQPERPPAWETPKGSERKGP